MRFLRHRFSRSRRARTTLLACTVMVLGVVAYGFKTNYTPGPVSAASLHGESLGGYSSHADFEKKCKLCHAPVHCLVADRCEVCHANIAEERALASGLHGQLPATERCQTCHSEHQGRNKSMNKIASINFDHEMLTGFSLIRHQNDHWDQELACDRCHVNGRYAPETVDCVTCHTAADENYMAEHTATFGTACFTCHDGQDRMADFDHNQIFALEGGHGGLECPDCHTGHLVAGSIDTCFACHPEPELHAGEFGLECERCHSAVAWTPAQLTYHPFPLDHGSQDEALCETCHLGAYVEHTCFGCHDHDLEQIQATHAELDTPDLDGCVRCHPAGLPGEAARLGFGEWQAP